jgi:hypothetical protein
VRSAPPPVAEAARRQPVGVERRHAGKTGRHNLPQKIASSRHLSLPDIHI